jgi:hypothetical protein
MKIHSNNRPILGSFRDGLIICRSMPVDAEGLAEFNSRIGDVCELTVIWNFLHTSPGISPGLMLDDHP